MRRGVENHQRGAAVCRLPCSENFAVFQVESASRGSGALRAVRGAGSPPTDQEAPMSSFAPVTEEIVRELQRICGEAHVSRDPAKLLRYSRDQVPEKRYQALPEVVVTPGTAAEVQEVVRLADRECVPVTPRGAGTGLSG